MAADLEKVPALIKNELEMIWAAHKACGLDGYMQLYTHPTQMPFRSKEAGISFWFNSSEIDLAVAEVLKYYNLGQLPNSTLLLNPIVHSKDEAGNYKPIGSGILWATALCMGIEQLSETSAQRLYELGVFATTFERGDNTQAGLKILAFPTEAQAPTDDGSTVVGCLELFELTNIKSEQYKAAYLLSAISYLTNNGLFQQPDSAALFLKPLPATEAEKIAYIKEAAINVQNILDANYCWNAYDRHHSLYQKFGRNSADVETNLRFFNLVARDVSLFDATGPMRKDAEEMFEFIVPGLIPRGSITLIAASGGTGKSSLAHYLCVMAATDFKPGEEAPRFLGQRIAIEKCQGICVYFSGEDGPPIINARAAIFDPMGRAKRLMFQRDEFGAGVSFAEYLKQLHKIPDVPIMVIDPARKFLNGDEDDAGVVSEFFQAIEDFALTKKTAVVVVHHLQKGAYPTSVRDTLDKLRGSQVFIDRPRVVIGMYRDGPYTVAGLAKNNIPPNMGMVMEERVFARDPQKLSLIWLPGNEGIRGGTLTKEQLEALEEEARKQGR